ncbi:MAG: hypothetical protein ACK5RS_13980 [Acidobacteriota bacterium]
MIKRTLTLTLLLLTTSGVVFSQGLTNEIRTGCRQALNQRLSRDNRGAAIQSTLRSARERIGGGAQMRISGEAEVSIDNGPSRTVSYECIYNIRGDFPESASYTFTGDNDWGGGNPGGGSGGGRPGEGWGRPRPGGGRGMNFDTLPSVTMRRGGRGGNIIEVKAEVDGMIDIFIRGDQVRYDVINGQNPNYMDVVASVVLPRRELDCQVEKRDGRSEILVIDQPSRFHNFTLHLQINDRAGGSDRYEARITW